MIHCKKIVLKKDLLEKEIMKKKVSVFVIAIWLCFSIFMLPYGQNSFQKAEGKEKKFSDFSVQDDKTAAEAYKNIQILKDIPASELIPTMLFIRNSLGVACSHCHVSGKFEADDKQTKQTARKMLQMVIDINKNSFIPQGKVNCNTCHRGQEKPQSEIIIPRDLTVSSSETAEQKELPQSSVELILENYVKAVGGRKALEKLKTRVMTGTFTTSRGTTAKTIIYQAAPNKKVEIRDFSDRRFSSGFDGKIGWQQDEGKEHKETTGENLLRTERGAEFYEPLKIRDMYSDMKLLGIEKLGTTDAFVIEGKPPFENTRERLYFDVESGLLLRILMLTDSHFGANPQATDFGDYREVKGVKLPFLIKVTTPDINVTRKFDSIKHNVRIDEAKFKPTLIIDK